MKAISILSACLLLGTTVLCGAQAEPAAIHLYPNSPSTQEPAFPDSQSGRGNSGNKAEQQKQNSKERTTGTSDDRLFWTLPNFLTVRTKNVPPLSVGAKFKVVTKQTFDPMEFVYAGFLAGISQASDSEPGFGQGVGGYAKRFGTSFADVGIENYFTGAIFPSFLKQDPRFYQLGEGRFFHRLGYAMSRIFVIRSDAGKSQFNASELGGSAFSAGISTFSYHPQEDRNIENALSVWGSQVGWDTVTLVVKEFWPDIRKKLTKRKVPPNAANSLAPSKDNSPK